MVLLAVAEIRAGDTDLRDRLHFAVAAIELVVLCGERTCTTSPYSTFN